MPFEIEVRTRFGKLVRADVYLPERGTGPFPVIFAAAPYLYSGRHPRRSMRRPADASRYRVTLDTAEDLELIRRLIEDHHAADLDAEQIIAVLDAHPELVAINEHVEQKKLSG